jgi:hypothetical protein
VNVMCIIMKRDELSQTIFKFFYDNLYLSNQDTCLAVSAMFARIAFK